MSTNRAKITRLIADMDMATRADLESAIAMQGDKWHNKKILDTLGDLVKAGFVKRVKDDVSGQPGYVLTPAGKAFNRVALVEDTQAGSGAKTPGSDVSETSVGNAAPLAEDIADQKACCNAAKVVAKTAGSVVGELQKRCTEQEKTISALEDDIRRQVQRAEAAEQNRNDIKQALDQANDANDNWIALAGEFECKSIIDLRVLINSAFERLEKLGAENVALRTLNQAMPGFGNQYDPIESPPHYTAGSIECIDAIESALSEEEMRGYIKGNAIKYIWREKHKGGEESIGKAVWYLRRFAE